MLIFVGKNVIGMETELNDADRVIGDGDHGAAMVRGFSAVIKEMEERKFQDLTTLFITAGNAMIASVGGSAGIIFGTFFRSGGKALNGSQVLDVEGIIHFLDESFIAIQHRGKAKPGDKTMLDALYSALEIARVSGDLPLGSFMDLVAKAAKFGMEKTSQMIAETGRAKDYRAKSLGRMDPGAITTFTIIDGMSRYINSIM